MIPRDPKPQAAVRGTGFGLPPLFLRGSWARLALSVLALATGVAGICAIDLVNRAVFRSFADIIDAMAGRAALQVTAGEGGLFREDVAAAVAEVPGVEVALPMVTGTAFTAEEPAEPLTVYGFDLGRGNPLDVYAPGSAQEISEPGLLRHDDAVVLAPTFAARRGLSVGDRIELETPKGRGSFLVGRLLEPWGVARMLGGSFVVMHLATAQILFARPGLINRVDVVVDRRAELATISTAIGAALPPGPRVELAAQRRVDLHRVMRSLQVMLWGAGAIGLFLCFLVAFNRLATHFEARAWEIGVLRAVGLRARAIWRELVRESLLLGAAGVLIGIPAGIGLGAALLPRVAATTSLNYKLLATDAELTLRPITLVIAAGAGLVAALLAGALPAWRAARVPVVETLGHRGMEQPGSSTGAMAMVRGAALVLSAAAVAVHATTRSAASGLVATALVVLLAALAARPLVRLARTLLIPALSALAGPAAPLACAALLRNARRTALTVAMAGVGLGGVLWLMTLARSFEESLVHVLTGTLRAELFVTSANVISGWVPAPLDDELLQSLATVPGVVAVAGNRVIDWPHAGGSIALNAFDPVYFTSPEFGRSPLLTGPASDVWPALAHGEAVLVSTNFAFRFGSRVNDTITLDTPSGPLPVRIAGITMAFMSPGGTIEMSRELYGRYWRDQQVNRIWVRTAPGRTEFVRQAIGGGLGRTHALRVFSAGEMVEHLSAEVRRAFAPLSLARDVVLLVVLLGVADALAAGVVQRTREIGWLRALGVPRRSVQRMVLAEGVALGLLGLVLAVTLGTGLGLLWVRATFPALLGWVLELHLPWREIASLGVVTIGVCLAAGILPARHAARLEPVAALRYE